jgi:4-amino-4-deoxy-L-arabinose transferase-like glycosyltransferase
MNEPLISDAVEDTKGNRGFQVAGMPWWALVFLALTVTVWLFTSHYRLSGGDDLLELWGDNVSSVGQLLHIARTSPIEVDPVLYPEIMYAGIRLFGVHSIALVVPSLVGFLAMQVSLFYFVRRIASDRAAAFALALPTITCAFAYTLQIRPYGLLLGLFGVAMLSWQTAVRRKTSRTGALVVLALSIALAINTHYYGVLLMVPVCIAELVRARQRRRLDVPMLISLGASMAGLVLLLPFLRGVSEFRSHYKAANVAYQSITQTYNYLLLEQGTFSERTNHLLAIALGLLMALVVWSCIRQRRDKTLSLPDAEFTFLLALAGLPVFVFLLGHFVTHAMEARYALGAVMGMVALLALALVPVLRNRAAGFLILVVLFVGFARKGIEGVRAEQRVRQSVLSELVLSPKIKAAILASPTQMLYTQDIDLFGLVAFHETDPEVQRHLALVYSTEEEMRWNHSETDSRIVEHLMAVNRYTILPYESVLKAPGEHLFVVTHGGWNWLDQAFASGQLEVTSVGAAFGGEVVSVRVPPIVQGSTGGATSRMERRPQ